MHFKIASLLTICGVFAAITYVSEVRGVSPKPIVAYDCEGNACSQVSLTWDNDRQQFRVQNDSGQMVKVEVTTFAGESAVRVEPHKSDYLAVKTFTSTIPTPATSASARPRRVTSSISPTL